MDSLPKNILLMIFNLLSKEDLSALMRQNRKIYVAATDNKLWKPIASNYGVDRYIKKEEEEKPQAYYQATNTFALSIDFPPSGKYIWRNPTLWVNFFSKLNCYFIPFFSSLNWTNKRKSNF